MSASYSGITDMVFIMGDDVTWTITVSVDGVTDLTGWTIRLLFTNEEDPADTFSKTDSDTDWIDNSAAASLKFDVLVDSTPTDIPTAGANYVVKAAIENGTTRHHLGSAQWKFRLPDGGAYADL